MGVYAPRPSRCPTIQLHCHLEGTINAQRLVELARLSDAESRLPSQDHEQLQAMLVGKTREAFFHALNITRPFRLRPDELRLIARWALESASNEGVVYSEFRINLENSMAHGLDPWDVLYAIDEELRDARRRAGVRSGLILAAERKFHMVPDIVGLGCAAWRKGLIVGIDLDGEEHLYPTEDFVDAFEPARRIGLPITIHAGEWSGPQSVWSALKCGATRIGHGIRSEEDDTLVDELVRRRIHLEMCPTSNVCTAVIHQLSEHPIRRYLDWGVSLSINPDDPAIFDSEVTREYQLVQEALGFGRDEVRRVNAYALDASFASQTDKREIAKLLQEPSTEPGAGGSA